MAAFVALFGAFATLFGMSTSPPASIAAPMPRGASDMIPVYVREILLQLRRPEDVRGRVNALNGIFVAAVPASKPGPSLQLRRARGLAARR